LTDEAEESPWYIRSMIAFGAWVASLFLMVFIGGIGSLFFDRESGLIIVALVVLVIVTILRRRTVPEFAQHLLLAFALGAQVLLSFGLAVTWRDTTAVILSLVLLQTLLIGVYPDRILRFLTTVAICAELVFLIFDSRIYWLLHALIALLGVATVWLAQREAHWYAGSLAQLHAPLYHGVLWGLLGVLCTSVLYVMPDWLHQAYLPRAWIATFVLGMVLLYTVNWMLRHCDFAVRDSIRLFIFLGTLCFILLSWRAPGLVAALLVMLLGFYSARRIIIGIAIAFFAIFLALFFYGFNVSLLHKSYTLMGTGVLVLVGWYLLRMQRLEAADA
jgi:hypothetical protein